MFPALAETWGGCGHSRLWREDVACFGVMDCCECRDKMGNIMKKFECSEC